MENGSQKNDLMNLLSRPLILDLLEKGPGHEGPKSPNAKKRAEPSGSWESFLNEEVLKFPALQLGSASPGRKTWGEISQNIAWNSPKNIFFKRNLTLSKNELARMNSDFSHRGPNGKVFREAEAASEQEKVIQSLQSYCRNKTEIKNNFYKICNLALKLKRTNAENIRTKVLHHKNPSCLFIESNFAMEENTQTFFEIPFDPNGRKGLNNQSMDSKQFGGECKKLKKLRGLPIFRKSLNARTKTEENKRPRERTAVPRRQTMMFRSITNCAQPLRRMAPRPMKLETKTPMAGKIEEEDNFAERNFNLAPRKRSITSKNSNQNGSRTEIVVPLSRQNRSDCSCNSDKNVSVEKIRGIMSIDMEVEEKIENQKELEKENNKPTMLKFLEKDIEKNAESPLRGLSSTRWKDSESAQETGKYSKKKNISGFLLQSVPMSSGFKSYCYNSNEKAIENLNKRRKTLSGQLRKGKSLLTIHSKKEENVSRDQEHQKQPTSCRKSPISFEFTKKDCYLKLFSTEKPRLITRSFLFNGKTESGQNSRGNSKGKEISSSKSKNKSGFVIHRKEKKIQSEGKPPIQMRKSLKSLQLKMHLKPSNNIFKHGSTGNIKKSIMNN